MNLTNVKAEKQRIEIYDGLAYGIQNYGLSNDYPQKIKTVTSASVTAKGCISTYQKFMQGGGFADLLFYKSIINSRGLVCDQLLNRIAKDIADYGGFSLHVNYNLLGKITDVSHVPFEHCRMAIEDESTGCVHKIALHRDWTRLKRKTVISKNTIQYIDVYNPIKEVVLAQIEACGGIDNYKGQIYYFSLDGDFIYPKPIYDAAITDISTESGISNVIYRNARMNFMPAGMLIRKTSQRSGIDNKDGRPLPDTFSQSFKKFQGDENACKIIDVEVEFGEEKPDFVPFIVDKKGDEMKLSTELVKEKIGKVFLQPPILRAENVSTGFTLQAMQDAYEYYNSITLSERLEIERVFTQIFTNFERPINPTNNYSILPLTYGQSNNSGTSQGTV